MTLAHREPNVETAQVAFSVERRIKQTIKGMRCAWVKLAADLFQFQEMEMWRDLGHGSFEAWLADPDVEVERRWAYQLIANWRELVVNRGVEASQLEELEPSKIQEVLPAVRRGYVEAADALSDVRMLGRQDLRERYHPDSPATHKTAGGARPDTGTGLDAEREPQYVRCPTCNSRVLEDALR